VDPGEQPALAPFQGSGARSEATPQDDTFAFQSREGNVGLGFRDA
jgi:hypothetical protein